jgi:hypothetical protein
MIRITRHIAITPIGNPPRRSTKLIPNRQALSSFTGGSFDLKGCTRKSVQKICWKRHCLLRVEVGLMAKVFMEVQGPIACSVWGETAGTGIWGDCQNWSHCVGPGNEGTAESRRSVSHFHILWRKRLPCRSFGRTADLPHINWRRKNTAQALSTEGNYGWLIGCLRGMTRPFTLSPDRSLLDVGSRMLTLSLFTVLST